MKNHLLIAKTNANSMKRKVAFRKLFLTLTVFAFIFSLSAISAPKGETMKVMAGTSLCVAAPFAAMKKDEDPAQYFKNYQAYLDQRLAEVGDQTELKTMLEALKISVSDAKADKTLIDNLKGEVEAINLKLTAEKEANKKKEYKAIKEQLIDWKEANKAVFASIKAGTKAELPAFEYKVASPMTPANTYNGSAYLPIPEFLPGINDIVRVQPTFWDYITKGRVGSAVLVWVNKKNPLGAAGFIGPGVAKPGVSFEIETETSNAKKIAVTEKCATELLDDIDGMASWIQQELAYQLRAKINTTLMNGTSSSTVPAGIQTLSTTYTLTTVSTTTPNNYDAIMACVAQLRSGNLVGPVTAFMNPIDYANMVMTKAVSQGQRFIPELTGATIVQDNNIPVGYLQIALLDYYKVAIYKDFQVTFGWENDDFTKNLVTTIAEMRIHQYFSENYTGAFIYDTFANIKTAITAV